MGKCNPTKTPAIKALNLTKKMSPKTQSEKKHMAKVPYSNSICSLMYAMVYTRVNIAFAVGMVSRYQQDPGPEHWRLAHSKNTRDGPT